MVARLTGSVYYNYVICPRKAWLMQYQIDPEHEHDLLDQGRLVQKEHYQRGKKELELPGIRVDHIRKEGESVVLGEIKKSSSGLAASVMQLAYYLSCVDAEGMKARGEILIPKERKKVSVELDAKTRAELAYATDEIKLLLENPRPPKAIRLKFCANCAYNEFCWSGGEEEG